MNFYIEKYLGPFYHPVIRSLRLKKNIKILSKKYLEYISIDTAQDGRFILDITILREFDSGTGISRVVKSFLQELESFNITKEIIYVYSKPARGFYDIKTNQLILINPNDVLFIPECNFATLIDNKKILLEAYKLGTKIYSFIYDIIPLLFPHTTDKNIRKRFPLYLESAMKYTGIISDSKSVTIDIQDYIKSHNIPDYNKSITLDYSYLGSTFSSHFIDKAKNSKTPVFLMVSTVEPRKKYDQVIKAFNNLWKQGYDVQLKIVGRPGWKNKKTLIMLEKSPYLNKKLFWYKTGISDEELSNLYQECTAVIFASLAEGYGLALVEAASYSKPLIIRDIPVFRELAGDTAMYFDGLKPKFVEDAVKDFLIQYKNGTTKTPVIKQNSWYEFTEKILKIMGII